MTSSPDRQRIRQILMPTGHPLPTEEEQLQPLLELFHVISPTRVADGATNPCAALAIGVTSAPTPPR